MRRKKQRAVGPKSLICEGLITAWRAEIDARRPADHLENHSPIGGLSLSIEGSLVDPIKGRDAFTFFLAGMADGPSLGGGVGNISQITPRVSGVMWLRWIDLQNVFTLACAGQLKSMMLHLDPPYRGRARIMYCSFFGGTMP